MNPLVRPIEPSGGLGLAFAVSRQIGVELGAELGLAGSPGGGPAGGSGPLSRIAWTSTERSTVSSFLSSVATQWRDWMEARLSTVGRAPSFASSLRAQLG